MKITVVGWYGTETTGDIAILDGILQIYGEITENLNCTIGSLYPMFSQRTLLLDEEILETNVNSCEFEIFDIKDDNELKLQIKNSDHVIMGGGPLMDLYELVYIKKAFKYAKKYNKKTIIFGCGLGPLNKKTYQNVVKDIFNLSDYIIFRDKASEEYAIKLYNKKFIEKTSSICDPALFSIMKYKSTNINKNKSSDIAINFRDVTSEYNEQNHKDLFKKIVLWSSEHYDNVTLIPMHTFSIGGDDREVFASLNMDLDCKNVTVVNKPLSLYEIYQHFERSLACIGMRYHSVVIQTLLNGNNFIIDYTKKDTGKISGFLNDVDNDGFYKKRIVNVATKYSNNIINKLDILKDNKHFEVSNNYFKSDLEKYKTLIISDKVDN